MSESGRFGGWSIDQKIFGWILSNLQVGSHILELGSGWGTGELGRYYQMHSIESELHWFNKFNSYYILAPIKDGWYDRSVLQEELHRIDYKLMLIDGPTHKDRTKLIENTDLFHWNTPVIVDDVQEQDVLEMGIFLSVEKCQRPYEIINGEQKKFMVIK